MGRNRLWGWQMIGRYYSRGCITRGGADILRIKENGVHAVCSVYYRWAIGNNLEGLAIPIKIYP